MAPPARLYRPPGPAYITVPACWSRQNVIARKGTHL